jgi:hypothetical protein
MARQLACAVGVSLRLTGCRDLHMYREPVLLGTLRQQCLGMKDEGTGGSTLVDTHAMKGVGIAHVIAETTTREEHSSLRDVDGTTNSSHTVVDFNSYIPQLNMSLTMGRRRGKQVGTQ